MEILPILTSKFTKFSGFDHYRLSSPIQEYFYIDYHIYELATIHGSYLNPNNRIRENILEGIQIIWDDNPFNLDYYNDNYIILNDK